MGQPQAGVMVSEQSELVKLAKAYRVAIEYVDQVGSTQRVSRDSLIAVLGSMGVDASTPESCVRELRKRELAKWHQGTAPTKVIAQGELAQSAELFAYLPTDAMCSTWIELEDGSRRYDVQIASDSDETQLLDGVELGRRRWYLPKELPLGWHMLSIAVSGIDGPSKEYRTTLVVTPDRLDTADEFFERPAWGIAAQLYCVRSRQSWGMGDLTDLEDLAAWSAVGAGADFLLVNPLHASAPSVPIEPSPYLPVTKRFPNAIYLRPEAIKEYSYLTPDRQSAIADIGQSVKASSLTSELLDRESVWRSKIEALEAIYQVPLTPGRQAQFDSYRFDENPGLFEFACWMALAEKHGPTWDEWPIALREHDSEEVQEELQALAARIEFFTWLQWVLDEQMDAAQSTARQCGMRIGIMHDLAVGVHQYGADTWANGGVMARGVTVGAPPDSFNQIGQDWNQPPPLPDALEQTGYAMVRDMLRTILRNSGGLRIDHILGFFRLWWIPEGAGAANGTYIAYDYEALINILILEAQRAGAVVVGEDLGTVEPWVRDVLSAKGILGTNILWFERDGDQPVDSSKWRRNAMSAVTVHDLPPTLGYLAGTHVELREKLNLLARPVAKEWEEHAKEIQSWRDLLESDGLIRTGASDEELLIALHRLAVRSRSALFAVGLPDLVGQRETQNQPGTKDEYPNWRIPLLDEDGKPVVLEDLPANPFVDRVLSALGSHGSYG